MHYVSKTRMTPTAVLLTPAQRPYRPAPPSWIARLLLAALARRRGAAS